MAIRGACFGADPFVWSACHRSQRAQASLLAGKPCPSEARKRHDRGKNVEMGCKGRRRARLTDSKRAPRGVSCSRSVWATEAALARRMQTSPRHRHGSCNARCSFSRADMKWLGLAIRPRASTQRVTFRQKCQHKAGLPEGPGLALQHSANKKGLTKSCWHRMSVIDQRKQDCHAAGGRRWLQLCRDQSKGGLPGGHVSLATGA